MNGLDRIGALALEVGNGFDFDKISSTTWSHYGFIMTDAKWVVENKTMQYDVWTNNGLITVQEDHNTLRDRKARTAIGYDSLTELSSANVAASASGTIYKIDDVDALVSTQDITFTAITDVSNNGNTVKFANNVELDVSGATILYVNSDGKVGIADGSIKTAIKDRADNYLANALYINVGTDADLLIVDQLTYLKSDWHADDQDVGTLNNLYDGIDNRNNNTIYGANAVTGNEKTVSFGALPTLTAGTAVNQTITINTANIDNGMAVTAQLVDATGNNPVTNGTLAVSNGTVSGNTATITLTGTPADDTTDVYVKVTVDGQSALSSKLTINAAESNVVLKLAGTDNKSLEYAAAGNFTVTAGYQNAWMQELKVSIKDSANGDATSKFTTAFTTGGIIANNNAGTDTLTITEKSGAAVGTYTATVTLGDKSESFTFAVTESEIADANGLTFTLPSDPTNSDTPNSLAVAPAKGGSEHYTVTSTKWFNGEDEVTGGTALGSGTVKLVIELTADANYKFASTATTNKQAGSSNKTATPVVAADGSTLTLTYSWTVS